MLAKIEKTAVIDLRAAMIFFLHTREKRNPLMQAPIPWSHAFSVLFLNIVSEPTLCSRFR